MRGVRGTLAGALFLISCGGDELLVPAQGEPAAIAIVSGDAQSGLVGSVLPNPLVIRVTASITCTFATDWVGRSGSMSMPAAGGVPAVFPSQGRMKATFRPLMSETPWRRLPSATTSTMSTFSE